MNHSLPAHNDPACRPANVGRRSSRWAFARSSAVGLILLILGLSLVGHEAGELFTSGLADDHEHVAQLCADPPAGDHFDAMPSIYADRCAACGLASIRFGDTRAAGRVRGDVVSGLPSHAPAHLPSQPRHARNTRAPPIS